MLFNVSYNDERIKNKINSLVGDSFSLLERLKKGGIGSGKLIITKADKEIENLLILDKNINYCNIEKRKNGIIIMFRSLLETFALVIPYYKLIIFKVTADEYTFNIDHKFLKIKVKNKSDHNFIRSITDDKVKNSSSYIT